MENKDRLGDIFEAFKDNTSVNFFNNNKYVGIEIAVSRTGWGFGAITLAHNLEDGTWHLDDECSSKERVTQFLHDAVPLIVDALYRKGNVKFEYKDEYDGWVVLENPNPEEEEEKDVPALPSYGKQMSELRPSNYKELSAEEQWMIDKDLGILDWDGK